jgi:hypothetical protein
MGELTKKSCERKKYVNKIDSKILEIPSNFLPWANKFLKVALKIGCNAKIHITYSNPLLAKNSKNVAHL